MNVLMKGVKVMNTEEEIRELWEDQTHFSKARRCATCGAKSLFVVTNNHDTYVQCLNSNCFFYDDTSESPIPTYYFPAGRYLDGRGNE